MKLLADINISPRVVAKLRKRGYDLHRVDAFLPPTAGDAEIAAVAREHGAAVITRDQDFAAILAMSQARAPSIVNVRLVQTEADFVATVIARVLTAYSDDIRVGAVVTVEEGGVRVHRLPIGSPG